jgi:hypothetical protein
VKQIETEIEIRSTPEIVWRILTNFSKYPQWNTFVDHISGEPKEGSKIVIHLNINGSRGITGKAILNKVDPYKELRWIGHAGTSGLFEGEHIFTIDPLGNGIVKFTHREVFTGLLVPLLSRRLNKGIQSYEAMNKSLKALAEKENS